MANSPLPSSRRGKANLSRGQLIDMKNELEGRKYYDPVTNPGGLIDISGASNEGMRDFLEKYCEDKKQKPSISNYLEYGGVAGPPELQQAVSNLVNDWFYPSIPIEPENILPTNGVSSLLDMVAFNIADANDGVLIPTPMYSMFEQDLCSRAGLNIIPVTMSQPLDQFDASHKKSLILEFERSLESAQRSGIQVKAVLICNPCNPVGRFYSRATLIAIASFCGKHGLHLVADEIYALSGFESPDGFDNFTSVLSLPNDPKQGILVHNIHSLYGASKDWSMGGLRLGFLITRNSELWNTCRRLALFTWVTPFATSFFTEFIGDKGNARRYIALNQARLREKYLLTTAAMQEEKVPFHPGNGGLFIWVDLSRWLGYFPGNDDITNPGESRETQLCRFLIERGVFMSMGELSLSSVPGHFRFVYTSPGDEALVAVRRIRKACVDLESQHEMAKYSFDSETSTQYSVQKEEQEVRGEARDMNTLKIATKVKTQWRRFLCM